MYKRDLSRSESCCRAESVGSFSSNSFSGAGAEGLGYSGTLYVRIWIHFRFRFSNRRKKWHHTFGNNLEPLFGGFFRIRGSIGRLLPGSRRLRLLPFPLQCNLEDLDVFSQRFVHVLVRSRIAFQFTDPGLHLRTFNVPRVPISFVSVPFCLEKSHHTYNRTKTNTYQHNDIPSRGNQSNKSKTQLKPKADRGVSLTLQSVFSPLRLTPIVVSVRISPTHPTTIPSHGRWRLPGHSSIKQWNARMKLSSLQP